MKNTQPTTNNSQRGFTAFIAIAITGTLLLVSTAVVTVALKETRLAASGRESQYAFYAADTGIECALYWDVKNTSGFSAFSTSSPSVIACNANSANTQGKTNPTPNSVGNSTVSTFNITFLPEPYCARVVVTKGMSGSNITTLIESYGYNTCDLANTRRVERAVRVSY
ncbi:MAG: hypothetical protein WD874_00390 [Parcubacteria group bacterium]